MSHNYNTGVNLITKINKNLKLLNLDIHHSVTTTVSNLFFCVALYKWKVRWPRPKYTFVGEHQYIKLYPLFCFKSMEFEQNLCNVGSLARRWYRASCMVFVITHFNHLLTGVSPTAARYSKNTLSEYTSSETQNSSD